MAGTGMTPEEVARRLLIEHLDRMELDFEDQEHLEAKQARKFRELDQAGAFSGHDRTGWTELVHRCDRAQYA